MYITANIFIMGLIIGYAGIKDAVINLSKGKIINTDKLKKNPFIIIMIICAFLLMVGERNVLNKLTFLLYGFAIGMAIAIVVERIERRLDSIEKNIKAEKKKNIQLRGNRVKSIRKSKLNK